MKPEAPSIAGGLPGAHVANALEHVNYQDGAISNSGVVKTANGSVGILAFDEGQSLPEHTAPFDALVHDCHLIAMKTDALRLGKELMSR